MPQHRSHIPPANGYHIYKRSAAETAAESVKRGWPHAHTQCGDDVPYGDTVNLRGDLSGVKIAECCIKAIGAE